jgi:hypothetical protein
MEGDQKKRAQHYKNPGLAPDDTLDECIRNNLKAPGNCKLVKP